MLTGKSLVSENTCKIPLGLFKSLLIQNPLNRLGFKLPVIKLNITLHFQQQRLKYRMWFCQSAYTNFHSYFK